MKRFNCTCGVSFPEPKYPVRCSCGRVHVSPTESVEPSKERLKEECCNGPGSVHEIKSKYHCQYRKVDGGELYFCIACRHISESPVNNHVCKGKVEPPEELKEVYPVKRMANFTASVIYHAAKGFPVRDKASIKNIWRTHCIKCDSFNPLKQTCMHCGCYVNLNGATEGLNMLAWAEKGCSDPNYPKFQPEKV